MEKLPREFYVACSGGVDSMAALDFLRRNHTVSAAYFDHGSDNSKDALAHAAEFARRVQTEAGSERDLQINVAYRWAYGREPSSAERAAAIEFLNQQAARNAAAASSTLTDFCQVLLNSNEFLYVD